MKDNRVLTLLAFLIVVYGAAFAYAADRARPGQGKPRYGIFGFGSLISDPGEELTKAIVSPC
jgi:hypothetical protein